MTHSTPHQQKITAAMQAREADIARAQADPARPRYHFTAPAGWLNDPNGTLYHAGWYHLFYQHHPFSDGWGPMYWGHARSRDLLHWQHLPIALAPEFDAADFPAIPADAEREMGIWSGCVALNEAGTPLAFYTAANMPFAPGVPLLCQQNAAMGSPDLLTWEKYPANPILPRDPAYRAEWRDPFIFHAEGRTFMVVGMCGTGTPLYEATDGSLLQWQYRGILCEIDAECPNFFQIDGGKWLFLSSPFNNVRYAIGEFDAESGRFTIEQAGRYDWSEFGHSDDYATNHLYSPDGRSILFGWVRGWENGHGWNGCMALPREVHLANDGSLSTPPLAEIAQLRGEGFALPALALNDAQHLPAFEPGLQYELHCTLTLAGAEKAGFGLRRSAAGLSNSALWLAADGLHLDGLHIPLSAQELAGAVEVRLLMDRSMAEIYVNGGQYCAVRVFNDFNPADSGISLFSSGGMAHFDDLQMWRLAETGYLQAA